MPSFELIDFRMSGKPRGTDVVADGVLANAIVLGGPLTPVSGLDLSLEGVVYEENGQRVATATAAEVMGNPLNSLAWLANALGRMGGTIRAGDVVLTGSISKVFRPKAGDSVRASFTRLGSVCRFTVLGISLLARSAPALSPSGARVPKFPLPSGRGQGEGWS